MQSQSTKQGNNTKKVKMVALNVAVIGAGTSGLCAAKYAKEAGFDVTIYEQNEWLGGIWWYTDLTGKDKYGINVHTAMYKELRTNLPHQLMEFPDHPYPDDAPSFPSQPRVLEFIQSYVNRFDLNKLIKFSHNVIRVQPIENGQWEVIVKDLANDAFVTKIYDVVIVCNGHHALPRIPQVQGMDIFKGKVLHSHDFRSADDYRDHKVLVIGNGASGVDVLRLLSKTSERVTFSVKKQSDKSFEMLRSKLPEKCSLQNVVKRFTETGAEFVDGSHETFTTVIWATGYDFSYPFLSADCGVHVDDRFLQPLYKQIINIHHPTMAFIGIPYTVCTTQMYDLQVRFAMQYITGAKKLPSTSEMLTDMRAVTQIHWNKGYPKRNTHFLGPEQKEYFDDLAGTAGIVNLPPVLAAIHFDCRQSMMKMPAEFRKFKYTVVDEKTFKKEKVEE